MWIASNINYDVNYKHSNIPLETINRKKGVYQDYSELFKALCDIATIQCHIVRGNGKTYSSDIGMDIRSDHAWNVVKLNKQYQLFDLTWSAGYVNDEVFTRRLNENYLNASPDYFIKDHFPDDPKWQLLEVPITKSQYIDAPTINEEFYRLNVKNLIPNSGIVRSDTFQLKFQSDIEITEATLFKWELSDYSTANGISLKVIKENDYYIIKYVEKKSGAYRYSIYLNGDASINFKLITSGFKPLRPTTWDIGSPHGLIEVYYYIFHSLDYDLFSTLNPNTEITVLGSIDYANELNSSLSNWYGDYESFYIYNRNGGVQYPINGFNIVLKKDSIGYVFQEILKK